MLASDQSSSSKISICTMSLINSSVAISEEVSVGIAVVGEDVEGILEDGGVDGVKVGAMVDTKVLIASEGNAVDDSCIVGVCVFLLSSLSDGGGDDNVGIDGIDVGIDDVVVTGKEVNFSGFYCSTPCIFR